MRAALTVDFLRRLPPGPCDVWDTKLTGFMLRVRPSGRAYWTVSRGRGQGRQETLGRVDLLTPAEARTLAQAVLGQASTDKALGKDPQEERRKRRAKEKAGTLRDFLTTQYAPWAEAHRKTGTETVARVTTAFAGLLKRRIPELTHFGFEQWRTARRKAGVTESTINRDFAALRSVLSKAMEWGVIAEHPMRKVKRQEKHDVLSRVRYLTPAEERRVRDALTVRDTARREGRARFNAWRAARGYQTLPEYGTYPDHLTPIVLLALNTGLRRGELLALKWAEVDLAHALLTVPGAAAKSGLTRHLPLNDDAARVLRDWRPSCASDTRVFPGPAGEPMTDLKTAWLKIAKAAALDNFRFHDLRHTFASKLVQAGVDLNTVRELLGHADIRMTLRYAHLAAEHKAVAVAKLVSA